MRTTDADGTLSGDKNLRSRVTDAFGAFFGRTDFVVAIVLLATLFSLVFAFKLLRADQMFGDSAMYLQATENIASRGLPVSQVKQSIDAYPAASTTSDELARNPSALFAGPTDTTERSLLLGHAYFILYPIGLVARIVPVKVVLLSLYAFAFVGLVGLAYFALRKRGAHPLGALFFCLLIIAQPAWNDGLLAGQFYPDRLFLFTGFALMVGALAQATTRTERVWNRIVLGLAALTSALANERGGLIAGIFLISYVALYWRRPGQDRIFRLALGAVSAVYGYGVLKYFLPSNTSYHSFLPTSMNAVTTLFNIPGFQNLIWLFFIVNAPLLILALFEWRAALIALLLMAPNIFGNIGGAEKVGWSTHYPSYYIPSLVWAALLGYQRLSEHLSRQRLVPALYAVVAAAIVFLAALNPYAYPLNIALSNMKNSFWPSFNDDVDVYFVKATAREDLLAAQAGILAAVPPHTVVSSVEAGMALLYHDRIVKFFPADIDHSQYAVLYAHMIDGKLNYYGMASFLDSTEKDKLNAIVIDRMKRDGFDVDHPLMFPAFSGLAVVKRNH